ncbi:hypothetical protein ATCVGM07011_213L [Acanthocystis turfacea Chlorella virus GM0701.1]|nr:hypothetical protein ATCVGM07011_213L [Acanthocystis turfacea Chlorella virus GM0701.1]
MYILFKMSTMSKMFPVLPMISSTFVMNQDIVDRIRASFTSHPVAPPIPAGGCVVMDDEQWAVYKKNLAREAKERKAAKKPVAQPAKRMVRNQRDTSFEPIEYSGKGFVKICTTRFSIQKFVCIDDVPGDRVYRDKIVACLRGETPFFDGYFWIPV